MRTRFTSLLVFAIPLLLSCRGGEKAREWHTADSTAVFAVADTGDVWRFDSEEFLQRRLSLLEAEAPGAGSERILREFRTVINGWVTDSLAERFWRGTQLNFNITDIPLSIEIGQPEGPPGYLCRAIINSEEGRFLVRSRTVTAERGPSLEYSVLSDNQFDYILRKLAGEYRLFDMESDIDRVAGENLAMTVLEANFLGDSTLLLFSEYKQPPGEFVRQMFDYLDTLFWGH